MRAAWIVRWCSDALSAGKVQPKALSEVLGRFNFGAAAVDVTKPFLGPVYTWVACVPAFAVLKVPVLIQLILQFLVKIYSDSSLFMVDARAPAISPIVAFRGDAHATGDEVGIGGWQSTCDTHDAAWFSIKLNRFSAPWLYAAGEPYRKFARTLACVMCLPLHRSAEGDAIHIAGEADNRGDSFGVGKWSTTKMPMLAIIMELALRCWQRGFEPHLAWLPREQKLEAEELSNGLTQRFSESRRAHIKVEDLQFEVLEGIPKAAEIMYAEVEQRARKSVDANASAMPAGIEHFQTPQQSVKIMRRPRTTRLKVTDPW